MFSKILRGCCVLQFQDVEMEQKYRDSIGKRSLQKGKVFVGFILTLASLNFLNQWRDVQDPEDRNQHILSFIIAFSLHCLSFGYLCVSKTGALSEYVLLWVVIVSSFNNAFFANPIRNERTITDAQPMANEWVDRCGKDLAESLMYLYRSAYTQMIYGVAFCIIPCRAVFALFFLTWMVLLHILKLLHERQLEGGGTDYQIVIFVTLSSIGIFVTSHGRDRDRRIIFFQNANMQKHANLYREHIGAQMGAPMQI